MTNSFDYTFGVREVSPFVFSMYDTFWGIMDQPVLTLHNMKLFVLFYADGGVLLAETSAGLQSVYLWMLLKQKYCFLDQEIN